MLMSSPCCSLSPPLPPLSLLCPFAATGGWGTIEYGTVEVAGQVEGGRWKPAHHWLQDHLFTDRLITCGADAASRNASSLTCLLKNDVYFGCTGDVLIEAIDLSGQPTSTHFTATGVSLKGGPGAAFWWSIPSVDDATSTILRATYYDALAGTVLAHNIIMLTSPGKLALQPVSVSVAYGASANADGTLDVVLSKPAGSPAAVFVTLTTQAQGRFSTNAFIMDGQTTTLQFIPFGALEAALLRRTLRVETANQYAASRDE